MEIIRYVEEEAAGNCKQPCSPGGKLASLLYSLFQQSKNNKKKKLPKSSKSEIEEGKLKKNTLYVSSSSSSEFRTPSLYCSKWKAWEEKFASDSCHESLKQEELWSAGLIKLEEKREFRKEDGAESDSSSDLFELKSYDLNDLST